MLSTGVLEGCACLITLILVSEDMILDLLANLIYQNAFLHILNFNKILRFKKAANCKFHVNMYLGPRATISGNEAVF